VGRTPRGTLWVRRTPWSGLPGCGEDWLFERDSGSKGTRAGPNIGVKISNLSHGGLGTQSMPPTIGGAHICGRCLILTPMAGPKGHPGVCPTLYRAWLTHKLSGGIGPAASLRFRE